MIKQPSLLGKIRFLRSLALVAPLVGGCASPIVEPTHHGEGDGSTGTDAQTLSDGGPATVSDGRSIDAPADYDACVSEAGTDAVGPPFVIATIEQEMNCGMLLRSHLNEPCIQPGFRCAQTIVGLGYYVDCTASCPHVWQVGGGGGPLAPPELIEA